MIDHALIAAHQWIVDESERPPKWWAEHVAWAYAAIGLAANATSLDGGLSIVLSALDLVGGGVFILIARVPFLLSSVGANARMRGLFWGILALYLSFLVRTPSALHAAHVMEGVFGLSFLYFATCRPPRPRRRRRQVAVQGGTA